MEAKPHPLGSIYFKIKNNTKSKLQRLRWSLNHGKWSNGELPPEFIGGGNGSVGHFMAETGGIFTGIEGSIAYEILDNSKEELIITFKKPFGGNQKYEVMVKTPQGVNSKKYSADHERNGRIDASDADISVFVWEAGTTPISNLSVKEEPSFDNQGSREISVKFDNQTKFDLFRRDTEIKWGIWSENELPPEKIPANTSGSFKIISDGFMTGVEALVVYAAGAIRFRCSLNNPYIGQNDNQIEVSSTDKTKEEEIQYFDTEIKIIEGGNKESIEIVVRYKKDDTP